MELMLPRLRLVPMSRPLVKGLCFGLEVSRANRLASTHQCLGSWAQVGMGSPGRLSGVSPGHQAEVASRLLRTVLASRIKQVALMPWQQRWAMDSKCCWDRVAVWFWRNSFPIGYSASSKPDRSRLVLADVQR